LYIQYILIPVSSLSPVIINLGVWGNRQMYRC
jgi:hypothetical protein